MTDPSSDIPLSLPSPSPNQPYMHVSALQAGIINLPADLIIQGQPRTYRACPSLAFYLTHSASGRNLIFDLGLRKDFTSYPALVQKHYLDSGLMPCEVPQDAAESCRKGGVDPTEVETVVISHIHFDHIGDHTPFSSATFILGGEAESLLASGYPGDATSRFLTDSAPAGRTRFLGDADFTASIGPFPRAHDLFGDGAAFVIDTPGHCGGHITLLVRTAPDGHWMFFGGDIAHDTRLLTDAATDITETAASGAPYCMHRDPARAREDIGRASALVKLPGVEFVIAHDWKWYEEHAETAFLPGRYAPKHV